MGAAKTPGRCCCGGASLAELGLPPAWPGVASDCRPWPRVGKPAVCQTCGLVQKIAASAWLADIAKIYGAYDIYHLSGGVEQLVFDGKDILTKSARMLACLQDCRPLPARGRLLDVGCGNGSLLRSFQALRPGWKLEGAEQNRRFEAAVRKMPGVVNFHAGPLASLKKKYDLIALMNVLEHVAEPVAMLSALRPLLAKNGKILIQVPNLLKNPFDLVVVDHRFHFVPATLARTAQGAGYKCLALRTTWIAKEISLLLAPGKAKVASSPARGSVDLHKASAGGAALWLKRCAAHAASLASEHGPRRFGIFGAAIAGTWLAGMLGRSFGFFVDEDPYKPERRHMGRPIYAPAQAPAGSFVYLAFPAPSAAKISSRLQSIHPHLRFILPPAMR